MILVAIIRIAIGVPRKVPDMSWLLVWNSVEMTLGKYPPYLTRYLLPGHGDGGF
jgi:hypothetical protein